MPGRGYKTEAVVLRSFRLGEADRVLHLYTLARGRVGAVAKGIRKTKSRCRARLEPLSPRCRSRRRGGDAAPLTRPGSEPARLSGGDALSRHPRRAPAGNDAPVP